MIISTRTSIGSSLSSSSLGDSDTPEFLGARGNRRDAPSMQDWPVVCQRRALRVRYVYHLDRSCVSRVRAIHDIKLKDRGLQEQLDALCLFSSVTRDLDIRHKLTTT
jgi:hypothetical protein